VDSWLDQTNSVADLVIAAIGIGSAVVGIVAWLNRRIAAHIAPVLEQLGTMQHNQDKLAESQDCLAEEIEANTQATHATKQSLWIVRQHQRQIGRQVGIPLEDLEDDDA